MNFPLTFLKPRSSWKAVALLLLLLAGTGSILDAQSFSGLPASMNQCDSLVTLTGSPTGGTFSGPGVSGTTFNPKTAGVGSHTVTYTPVAGYSVSGIPFVGISGGGTTISLADDGNSGSLPLGFTFNFYGTNYTSGVVSSNGFMTFTTGQTPNGYGQAIPNVTAPNNLIAFAWADLDPANGLQGNGENRIWYTTVGTAPNRQFRLTFWRVDQFPDGNNIIVRLTLYESSDNIEIHSASIPSDGGFMTQGVENATGTAAVTVPGRNSAVWSATNSSFRFTPSAAVSQTVTVTADVTPPNAICQSANVFLDAGGNGSLAAADVDGGSNDVCSGIQSLSVSPSAFTQANIGPNPVLLTVTDSTGNTDTCTATVTVQDTFGVSAVCQDITVHLGGSGMATINAADVDGGSTSNAGIASRTVSQDSFLCGNIGANMVQLVVTDGNGETDSCMATVTVLDSIAPAATCQNLTVQLNSAGDGSITAASANNGSTDNCAIQSLSLNDSTFNCSDVGTTSVALTVTDPSGNSSSCTSTIVVQDSFPPAVVCQDVTVFLDGAGQATILPSDADNGSVDGCGIESLSLTVSTFTCADVGGTTSTLMAVDSNGLSGTCSFSVTVNDTLAPSIVCPPDTTISTDAGVCGANYSYSVSTSDNCGFVSSSILKPGDIVFTAFKSDNPDGFAFLFLRDVPAGTQIGFTDNGWRAIGGFRGGEVSRNWMTSTDLPAGTHVIVDNGVASIGTINGGLALSADGDQVIAFQGSIGSPRLLAGIQMNGPWDADATTANTSALPTGLTEGIHAFSLPSEMDNAIYNCSDSSGETSALRAAIGDPANWTASNSSILAYPACTFIVVNQTPANQTSGLGSGSLFPVGMTTESYSVTDAGGNTDSCSFTINVMDNEAPNALCQDLTVYLDGTGSAAATSNDVDSSSNDACGIASLALSDTSFSCINTGSNTVTLTVTDGNNNTSTCTATITVEDSIAPVVNCQSMTVFLDGSGNASISTSDVDSSNSDACGIASLTLSDTSFACSDVGANMVTLTATDNNGNVDSCMATITVGDSLAPIAVCQDITVHLDGSGAASITAAAVDSSSSDACGIASLMVSDTSFVCADVGANAVTLTVTDNNGNSSTCTSNVTVLDSIAPTAICQDVTVFLDAAGNGGITASDVDNGSNDNCTLASISVSDTSFACADVGTNTVTLTVTDVNANTSTCTATVTVEDSIAPVVNCQDLTVFLDGSGNATISASDVDSSSSDACGIASLTLSDTSFACTDVGANMVTLTATDNNGNVASCVATITVVDSLTPIAICQDITIQLDGSGSASITAADVDGGSNDPCGIASLTVSETSFACADVGVNSVTLTATDSSGNVGSCSALVTVADTVSPIAVCQDVTLHLNFAGNATLTTVSLDGGSSDNCMIQGFNTTPTSFTCANVGTNPQTLTVIDVNGNSSNCTSNVTIADSIAPVVNCQGLTVFLDGSGNATISASDVDSSSSDACGIASLTLSDTSFACSDVGANMVTLTATDNNGNVASCMATITVVDSIAPMAVCQDITIHLDGSGAASITAADVDSSSSDACGIASLTVSDTSFACTDVGSNVVTLTVTDNNGNSSTCTSNVTVLDTIAPTAVCQDVTVFLDAAGNGGITASDADNSSNDNCALASVSVSDTSFACSDVGSNTVTLTVTDVNANTSTCTATITVEDSIAPVVNCQNLTVFLDGSGNATISASDVDSSSSDACGIASLTLSDTSFACSDVGANMVTLTATDNNGNVDSCMTTITVVDSIAPTAICQDITIHLDGSGAASITAADVDSSSSDACGIASLTVSDTSFACTDVGSNVVTLTVTDNNGNSSTCTSNVTVLDTIAPTAICQDVTVFLDAAGNGGITASDVDNGSNDNCALASVSVSDTSFACADVGSNTVTLTVTDVNANTSTCTATITVEDSIAPVVNCQGLTVFLDGSGNATISASDVDSSSSDACGIASLTLSDTSFACADVGANMVTLTATDNNGNVDSCMATITVIDSIAPTAVCQDITVQLDGSGAASITAADVDSASSDACGIASLMVSDTSFVCADVGSNTVTLTVTDNNGNSSTCTSNVTVLDTIAPTAICQDVTVFLDAAGNGGITASDVDNGSNDNCALASVSVSDTSFACADVGTNTVTLTVTDVNANTSTCTATITVEDSIAPVVNCQNLTVFLDGSGNTTISASDVDSSSSDACGIASLTLSDTSFACADVGANMVTLTATDNNGNVDSCMATITVVDSIAPMAICQDITVHLDGSGTASITAADVDSSSSDACGIASLMVSDTSFACADVGSNVVTLTVTDNNGNSSTCTSNVTVLDSIAPTAICQDVTVFLDAAGNGGITASDVDNGSNDNCALASVSVSDTSFACADVGSNTVTLTVTDVNANTSTCTATITVEDSIAPVVNCQNLTVFLDGSGNATISASDIDSSSSDACGIASLTLSDTSFACADVGANMVTLTATDNNGNVDSCMATITVVDSIAPMAICQDITVHLDGSGTASITAADVDSSSSDACGIASLMVSDTSFACADVGSNVVTLTVTDNNGNSSTCTSNVTVLDSIAPTAICQDVTVFLDAAGNGGITASDVDNGSNDNCALASVSVSDTSFACADVGSNTVTLTVTDVNGNSSTCTSTVTVVDSIAPVVNCQGLTVFLDGSGNATISASDVDSSSSDACGIASLTLSDTSFACSDVGANMVTLTATDNNGNVASCMATITVVDSIAPMAVCQDITVHLDGSGTASITAADVDSSSSDACGIASLMVSDTSFACADVGSNVVTLTVTDNNGNSSTCTSNVTVLDTIAPTAICQDVTVFLDAAGNGGITASDVDNGSNDNCALASVSVSDTSFACADVGSNTVTLTATDVNGNSSTCTSTVTVVDSIAPSAICQDFTVYLDANGMVTIFDSDVDDSSNDACGIASTVIDSSDFDCSHVGPNTVTLTVTDNNGNSATCTSTVTVMDTIAPIAVCQNLTVWLDSTGNASITPADVDNGSNDACGIDSLSLDMAALTCSEVGVNTVLLTAVDVNGNSSTCTSMIQVNDTIAPTALCQDISVYLDNSGTVNIQPTDIDNGSNDACGIDSYSATQVDFFCADTGVTVVTLFVKDNNNNTSMCTSNVTVLDTVAPVAVCLDLTIQVNSNQVTVVDPLDLNGGSSDACGFAGFVLSQDTFSCNDFGVNSVVLTVTDVNGNVDSCTATITVEVDSLVLALSSPVVGCGTNVSCNGASDGAIDGSAVGGCEPYTYSWSTGDTTSSLSNLGAGTYVVTLTDGLGNMLVDSIVLTSPDPILIALVGDTVCLGDSSGTIDLTASGGNDCAAYSYLWSTGATTEDLSGLPVGWYSVTVTDTLGCVGTDSIEITDRPLPVVDLGNDTVVCPSSPVTLTGVPGFVNYVWSTGDSLSSITVVDSGTYALTVTDIFGCSNSDEVHIGFFATDDTLITPNENLFICIGDTLELIGDGGYQSYLWSNGDTTTSTFIVGVGGTISLSVVDANGCTVTDEVVVDFINQPKPEPMILPGLEVTICEGSSETLDVLTGYFSYSWNTGDTTRAIQVDSSGQYQVTVTNGFGCVGVSEIATVTEVLNPVPVATLQNDTLFASSGFVSYQWYFNGNLIPGAILDYHVPLNTGAYAVAVIDTNGCSGLSAEVSVELGVSAESATESILGLDLYPNPSNGQVFVRSLKPINWNVEINVMDMYGHLVKTIPVGHLADEVELDLTSVANGMYLLKVEDEKGRVKMFRLVIE